MSEMPSQGIWTMLEDINSTKTTWMLQLRAIHVYHIPPWSKGGDSMEVIFHDRVGTRIHAHLKKLEKTRFGKQIVEDGVFGIRNVLVHNNYLSIKTTKHPSLLVFFKNTEVKTLGEKHFPRFKYDLKTFSSIQSQSFLNDQLLIDVIGKIISRTKVQTHIKRGGEERFMEIVLEDHEGNRMPCTLWGEYVDKFLIRLNEDVPGPFILLLSFCRLRRYMGSVSVTTSFHVTRMIFDGNSDEVNQFRALLPLQIEDDSSLSSLMLVGENEEDNTTFKITSLKGLLDTNKAGSYWIMAEISSLENTPDWCYMGCTNCNKKVIPDQAQFKCGGCDLTMPHGVYKFKVNVHVFDSSSHATFILWDRECKEILGASAYLLREMMLQRKMDPNLFPTELNHLIGKKGLFHVNLKDEGGGPYWNGPRSFGVRSFVSDPNILEKYDYVFEDVDEGGNDDETDGLWASLEDLSQKVEEIGSNNPKLSHGEATSKRKIDGIGSDDTVRRELLDELSTTCSKKVKKEALEKQV